MFLLGWFNTRPCWCLGDSQYVVLIFCFKWVVLKTQIKYLLFVGLAKKEEILFKSFLNLARNDLDYQVVVLKSSQVEEDAPDIVIMDENHVLNEEEQILKDLPTVLVGDDYRAEDDFYVTRPVQWSEFRHAIVSLDIKVDEPKVEQIDRILPEEVKMAIADSETDADQGNQKSETKYSDKGEYEFELDQLSTDYHSFSNSEYVKVVDDVRQFQKYNKGSTDEQVLLVTDDESNFANSVLVLETASMDAWELSESDFTAADVEERHSVIEGFSESVVDDVVEKKRSGTPIFRDDEFWLQDCEVIVDNRTFMYIKAKREMVYSEFEPGKWPEILHRGALSMTPLEDDWRPKESLQVFPLSSLKWVHTLVNATSDLHSRFDDDALYQLESWPTFNLLELDNVLLRLCTMLFVRPESVSSLASKSGYGKSTIRGLMNACYEMGCLKLPEHIAGEQLVAARSAEEGMLGKIKDVFR